MCYLVIAILYCSLYCYTKDIYKVDMIQVCWCACYDVPLSFCLALFFISQWDESELTFT